MVAIRSFALAALALLLNASTTVPAQQDAFERWAESVAAEIVRAAPLAATSAQYFTGAEEDALDRQLTPITREYRQSRAARARATLDELAQFDRSSLTADERVSAAMIEWSRRAVVEAEPFADYAFVF